MEGEVFDVTDWAACQVCNRLSPPFSNMRTLNFKVACHSRQSQLRRYLAQRSNTETDKKD